MVSSVAEISQLSARKLMAVALTGGKSADERDDKQYCKLK